MPATTIPSFNDLPPVPGFPQSKCSWGIFDKDGQKDLYGTLNFLTPDVVKSAAAEIREGISVSLNWPIGSIKIPEFFRKSLCHRVLKLEDPTGKVIGYDDEVEFNTQASSQWDSLCHYRHLPTGQSYNSFKPTISTLESDNNLPTLNHWHTRGYLTGRGVLLDFKSYATSKKISYSPFTSHCLAATDLEAIATHQNTPLLPGDILLIRTGFTEALTPLSGPEQASALSTLQVCGLEGSEEMARWLWNHQFSAVASDNLAVEAIPSVVDGVERPATELVLHQWCLALLGMPLGELWDLRGLAEECERIGRWSFFLTSVPLNVPGAVGSPPNALAVL
ncbi:hypothetical protein BDV29DRAFT_189323 [Aspergillus leporis]|uniref:Cyclase-domain-containing protein n=1 Tax=Aspergillus leporis TaxID=41062 RepID=A0A5N5XB24_9EURO|nr:hypothetical protein BDV29DRAFT_189323 [Aspergillus leporis]